jgi:hypothetical protein
MPPVGVGFHTDASIADVEIGDHPMPGHPAAKSASSASSRRHGIALDFFAALSCCRGG